MRFFNFLLTSLVALGSVIALDNAHPHKGPLELWSGKNGNVPKRWPHRSQHHKRGEGRDIVTIRASLNETDDVSVDFLNGIKEANNGGTLYLKENETYVIGQKLDLSFLNDIEVNLEGEILVSLGDQREKYDLVESTTVHRRPGLLAR